MQYKEICIYKIMVQHISDSCGCGVWELKLFRSDIEDGRHSGHLENLFFASSLEPKGQTDSKLGRKHRGDW